MSWFSRPTSSTCILVNDRALRTFLQVNRVSEATSSRLAKLHPAGIPSSLTTLPKGGFNQMAALASGGHSRPVPQRCVVRTGPDRNSHFTSHAGSLASAAQGSRMTTFTILLQTRDALTGAVPPPVPRARTHASISGSVHTTDATARPVLPVPGQGCQISLPGGANDGGLTCCTMEQSFKGDGQVEDSHQGPSLGNAAFLRD